jgi:hypothetical protein
MTVSTTLAWAEMAQARAAGSGTPSAGEWAWGGLLDDGVNAAGGERPGAAHLGGRSWLAARVRCWQQRACDSATEGEVEG